MPINIREPEYSLFSLDNFFYGGDYVRIIIMIYIFLSFLLNVLNFCAVVISKCLKKQLSFVIIVPFFFLLINFFHTAAYIFEWIIKDKNIIITNKNTVEVGGLLLGNPSNFDACYAQAFILISTSISQDFIINIFFYIITLSEEQLKNTKLKLRIILLLLILGLIFPIGFTLFYFFFGYLGLNDKFCYVAKYKYKINYDKNEVEYSKYDKFQILVMIVYGIRVFNFFITLFFLIKIIKYVKKVKQSKTYIFKLMIIPLIQLFTIFIGVAYILFNFSKENNDNEIIVNIYLILNTADGVLFPLIFLLQNNIFKSIKDYFSVDILEISEDDNSILEDNISDYNGKDYSN